MEQSCNDTNVCSSFKKSSLCSNCVCVRVSTPADEPQIAQSTLAPVIWPRKETMMVFLHSMFRLTCRGQAEVVWDGPVSLDKQKIDDKRGLFVSTVTVDSATATHTGEYTCFYKNENQTDKSSIYIFVPGMERQRQEGREKEETGHRTL